VYGLEGLFSVEAISAINDLIETLAILFMLRQFLKGNKPDDIEVKDDKIIIKKGDSQVIIEWN